MRKAFCIGYRGTGNSSSLGVVFLREQDLHIFEVLRLVIERPHYLQEDLIIIEFSMLKLTPIDVRNK
jgi:hypothetical protein